MRNAEAKTVSVLRTEHVIGTTIYMAPEVHQGESSTAQDIYALGVVILEVLTGLPVTNPRPGHRSLTLLADDFWDEKDKLKPLLDSAIFWDDHVVETLTDIASPEACLHTRFKRRPKAADLLLKMEAVCSVIPIEVPIATRINPDFFCPITGEIMRDPVITTGGHSYERAAIEEWFAMHRSDPKTNMVLESRALMPNHTLRSAIEEACGQL